MGVHILIEIDTHRLAQCPVIHSDWDSATLYAPIVSNVKMIKGI
jgi:hypothetical protein